MAFDPFIYIPKTLDELNAKLASLSSEWIYRGVSDAQWSLDSSLERMLRGSSKLLEVEQALLDRFQAEAGNYISSGYVPPIEARLEWLATMQHYGAPTRLLDWTKSPYVALYFASEASPGPGSANCAIWAVRLPHILRDATKAVLEHVPEERPNPSVLDIMNGKTYERHLVYSADIHAIFPYVPPRLHGRLVSQQGLFLYATNLGDPSAGDSNVPFERSLMHNFADDIHKNITKILVPSEWQRDILKQLMRMNITRSSLFPGLDGFSASLKSLVRAFGEDIPWP